MLYIDLDFLLKEGKLNGEFTPKNKSDLRNEYGNPSEIETYNGSEVYYHYGNIRFKVDEDTIEEIVIFPSDNEFDKLYISETGEQMKVFKNFLLHEMLFYLNDRKILWDISYKESNLDYLIVNANQKVKLYYYLQDGFLERISYRIE